MRLFYSAFESIFDPVFESQVMVLLSNINDRLSPSGQSVNLVIFGSIEDLFKGAYIQRKRYIKKFLNNRCIFSFKFPYLHRFSIFFRLSLLINTLICFFTLYFIVRLKRSEKALFHCRTEIVSYILLVLKRTFFKNIKVICDCRGIGSKELLYKYNIKNNNIAFEVVEKIENYSHKNSDYIFCVSNSFRNYIRERTSRVDNIKVIPCCLDTDIFKYDSNERKKIRNYFNVENKFVLLYSGSLNEWQLPLEMIKIFIVFKTVFKNSIFIIFTGDIKYAREIFLNSGLKKDEYIVSSIPHHLINKYLLVGDIGLLIRQDNDVNKVAFPVKFYEYVRCGVPVLSSITSDLKDLIIKYDLGFWISDYGNEFEIKRIAMLLKNKVDYFKSDEYKKKLSKAIEREISWDNYLDSIINVYEGV